MPPTIPYLACVVGAAALYLVLQPGKPALRAAGALLGLGALLWLLLEAGRIGLAAADSRPLTESLPPRVIFVIFGLIAVASAVRMITHSKPVYSALYFVMVVLSSAGLFLLLQAEFMAFALIIVYAGAILITYMFVLMLAQQAPPGEGTVAEQSSGISMQSTHYDVQPREPGYAAGVGFILLALFTHMIFTGAENLPPRVAPEQAQVQMWERLEMMPGSLNQVVQIVEPNAVVVKPADVQVIEGVPFVAVVRAGESQPTLLALPPDALPGNVQMVGLDLVARFPVSLELAGIILLLAMFGAVVLARKQIELGEDEVREAAGMKRLAFHTDEHGEPGPSAVDGMRGGGR